MIRLYELRKAQNLKQQDLADYIGVSQSSISAYEREEVDMPYFVLKQFSKLFDVTIDYLVGFDPINRAKSCRFKDPVTKKEYYVQKELREQGDLFIISAKDNKNAPRIQKGDTLIGIKTTKVSFEDYAVIRFRGTSNLICKLESFRDGAVLKYQNPFCKNEFLSNKDIEERGMVVLGRVVEVRGKIEKGMIDTIQQLADSV